MTVAAVILVPDPAVAELDAEGLPALRRIVQSAWSGGAMPIVVVSRPGPEGESLRALIEGLPASLILPADVQPGSAWFGTGMSAAVAQVRETRAALLWPCRYAWLDPETVTSLIEAHGSAPETICRASFQGRAGMPILLPADLTPRFLEEPSLHAFELVEKLAAAGSPVRQVELGDPGIVHDVSTARSEMPPYQGPTEPASGMPPEWNEELARHATPASEPSADN